MTKLPTTSDATIRAKMKALLSRRHATDLDAFVVEELPVCRGGARLDLAVINGRIEGVEIKSCLDTLERLPRQLELYGESVDLMTLVVSPRHLDAALGMVPSWWKVLVARAGARGGVALERVRTGRLNSAVSQSGLLRLLERDELLGVLARHGLDRGWRSSPWRALADRAAGMIPASTMAFEVRRQLKVRVLLESRFSNSAFGASAAGGGTTSSALVDGHLTQLMPAA